MSSVYKKNDVKSVNNNSPIPGQRKKGKKPERGLKALASGSLAIARFHTILDKTEKQLELELQRDNRAPPQTCIGKTRRKGEDILQSKPILFCVIILNVIDCVLVLGELILDMYYVKGLLQTSEDTSTKFIHDMKLLYPVELADLTSDTDIETLQHHLLHAHIEFQHVTNVNNTSNQSVKSACNYNSTFPGVVSTPSFVETFNGSRNANDTVTDSANVTDNGYLNRTKRDVIDSSNKTSSDLSMNSINVNDHLDNASSYLNDYHVTHGHSLEEDLAHAFHKASITILGILALETLLKIFAHGSHFLEKKLEVFDCIIVYSSLFVDIYLLDGISAYRVRDFVIILAFLVPWRVIRVVNSLVVAVIDHEHFRLKLLYKQKKEVTNDLKKSKADVKMLEQSLDILKILATNAGVSEQKIDKHLAFVHQNIGKHKKKGGLGFGHSFPLFQHSFHHSPKQSHSTSSLNSNTNTHDNDVTSCHDNKGYDHDVIVMPNCKTDFMSIGGDDSPSNTVFTCETGFVPNSNITNGDII